MVASHRVAASEVRAAKILKERGPAALTAAEAVRDALVAAEQSPTAGLDIAGACTECHAPPEFDHYEGCSYIAEAIHRAMRTATRRRLAREVLDRYSQWVGATEEDARRGNDPREGFASEVPIYAACERYLEAADPDAETGVDFEDVEAVVALAEKEVA